MDRKKFLQKGILGVGSIVAIPTIISGCSEEDIKEDQENQTGTCALSPKETAGPFPIKSPSDLVQANIVGDRKGVPMVLNITVQDQSNGCKPFANTFVDVWHCDADGYYSQYGGTRMQKEDFTGNNFLRGRQKTDANGNVSFVTIFPGWYRGRAPHIHLEILDANEKSLRVSQIAFPKDTCDVVYATSEYNGEQDTINSKDNVFSDSEKGNMLDSLTGNTTKGYTLTKIIIV